MKKLAARDYEDILQCSIPCFEGLFGNPEMNKLVLDLLFILATFHAYTKLQMHDDSTVASFEEVTTLLGTYICKFAKASAEFQTVETLSEHGKCQDHESSHLAAGIAVKNSGGGAYVQKFNMTTAKLHFLGDYPASIKMYGTTDGYSSLIGEIANQDEHSRELQKMEKNDPYYNITAESDPKKKKTRKQEAMKIEKKPIAQMDLNATWQIAQGQHNRRHLSEFSDDSDSTLL
ncbi:hypothetical protein Moror_12124, partial [Moniliophthora roreri MCA 2997]